MAFLSEFEAFFTTEEKDSEIFKILSMIGVNTEKAILEEMNAEIRRSTELMAFPDQRLRSWLAFFLRKVRNMVSARGFGTIQLLGKKSDTAPDLVTILGNAIVESRSGKQYTLDGSAALHISVGDRDPTPFRFIEGSSSTVSGTYNEFIAIPAQGVDLDNIQVTVDGKDVPPVPEAYPATDSVYAYLQAYSKPWMDESAALDWNDALVKQQWVMTGISDALKRTYIRPYGGFFAFYYGGMLYIKVYRGGDVGDPSSKSYTVAYWHSNGAQGNMGVNQLDHFNGIPDLNNYDYLLTNDPVYTGADAPSHSELVNLLREKFFVTTNVASVMEYTAWFMARNEVLDCIVVSDYEKWRRTGFQDKSSLSGAVDVYLMGENAQSLVPADSQPVSTGAGSIDPKAEILRVLDDDLSSVRDLAIINYKPFKQFEHFYVVQYNSTSNDLLFQTAVISTLGSFYEPENVKTVGTSLFQELDLETVQRAIGDLYSPVGLRIIPYHHFTVPIYTDKDVSADNAHSFVAYSGGTGGGWYEFWEYIDKDNPDASQMRLKCAFREFVSDDGTCAIRPVDKTGVGALWNPNQSTQPSVGLRTANGVINFDAKTFNADDAGILHCLWAVKNQGMVPVGCNTPTEFGVRALTTWNCGFGAGVRFEKY